MSEHTRYDVTKVSDQDIEAGYTEILSHSSKIIFILRMKPTDYVHMMRAHKCLA